MKLLHTICTYKQKPPQPPRHGFACLFRGFVCIFVLFCQPTEHEAVWFPFWRFAYDRAAAAAQKHRFEGSDAERWFSSQGNKAELNHQLACASLTRWSGSGRSTSEVPCLDPTFRLIVQGKVSCPLLSGECSFTPEAS